MAFGIHIVAAVEQLMHAPPSLLQRALPSVTNGLCIGWAMTSSKEEHHRRLLESRHLDCLSLFEDISSKSVVAIILQRLHSLVDWTEREYQCKGLNAVYPDTTISSVCAHTLWCNERSGKQ
jgi:hypothetical protein